MSIQSWNFFIGLKITASALDSLLLPLRSNHPESWVKASPMASPETGVTIMSLIDTGSLNSINSQSVEVPSVQRNASGTETRFARANM